MHRRLLLLAFALVLLVPPANALAVHFGERTLRKGMSGSDVRALQRYLGQVGIETTVDGQFGPMTAASVRQWESSEGRTVNGVVTPSEARALRQDAAEAETTETPDTPTPTPAPTEKATLTEDGLAVAPASAPPEVQAVIDAGNRIASKPYKYGGGHGRWRDSGYDCSGSMSYVLHAAGLLDTPLDSSGFATYGERGRGTWITTYGNSGHSYMLVAGLRFDTSARRLTGTRWTTEMRSPRGYARRHPSGL
jgi:Putative peptidoglycan binding domain